jgi:hypothetical protein
VPRPAVPVVSRVASLLTAQGGGEMLFAAFGALMTPMQLYYRERSARSPVPPLEVACLFGYFLCGALVGALSREAGRRNSEYRDRRLGFVALALGPLFCQLGIPIALYGIWSYCRKDVKELFVLGESGVGAWDIEHEESVGA